MLGLHSQCRDPVLTCSEVVLTLFVSGLTVSREAVGLIVHTWTEVRQEIVSGTVRMITSAVLLYVTFISLWSAHRAILAELAVILAA